MNPQSLPIILEKLHSFISPAFLFVVLGLLCIFFGIASFVLMFHWNRYAIDKSSIVSAEAIYFLGGILIMIIGFVSVLLF